MEFEWDERKNQENIRRHGIDFAIGARIFDGPVVRKPDDRKDYGELRYIALAVWNRRFLLSCIRYEIHDIVLFQHGGLIDVNEERIVRYTQKNLPKGDTDWKRVKALTDEEIEAAVREDPEAAPITDEDFWKEATLVWPKEKQHISLRLDYEVYWWLKQYAKKEGKGYQTLINAILRSWIEIQKGKHPLPQPKS